MSRWISSVRPPWRPLDASRRVRSSVARGSMPYSAVIHPRAWPLSHGGSLSSSVAVTSTWVSPNFTRQEPSACFTTPRSSVTARSSSGCRRLGRVNPRRPDTEDCALSIFSDIDTAASSSVRQAIQEAPSERHPEDAFRHRALTFFVS